MTAQLVSSPATRITAYQRLCAQIEAMGLPPQKRREALERARDEIGVSRLAAHDRPVGASRDADLSEDEYREKCRIANAKSRIAKLSKMVVAK